MKRNGVYVIIPVYNEQKVLLQTIKDLRSSKHKNIIIVDDGSTDNTLQLIKKSGVHYLHHRVNRGKGAALKTGFAAAQIMQANQLVTMDGDGQHDPRDIDKLLRHIQKGYDVVLGNRMAYKKKMPYLRVFANFFANVITWFAYGIWVQDSQCGLRAYSKKAIDVIDIHKDKYEYDSEIIRELSKKKLRFSEVPVQAYYSKYSLEKKDRQSFIKGLYTAMRLLIDEEI